MRPSISGSGIDCTSLRATSLWADGADDITYDTKYMRVWQVRGGALRTVSITIYAENASNRKQSELIRATTLVSGTF